MPEPDFDQIARRLWTEVDGSPDDVADDDEIASIAEQLRQVWNARGAADLEAVNDIAHTNEQRIETAIRNLDR